MKRNVNIKNHQSQTNLQLFGEVFFFRPKSSTYQFSDCDLNLAACVNVFDQFKVMYTAKLLFHSHQPFLKKAKLFCNLQHNSATDFAMTKFFFLQIFLFSKRQLQNQIFVYSVTKLTFTFDAKFLANQRNVLFRIENCNFFLKSC